MPRASRLTMIASSIGALAVAVGVLLASEPTPAKAQSWLPWDDTASYQGRRRAREIYSSSRERRVRTPQRTRDDDDDDRPRTRASRDDRRSVDTTMPVRAAGAAPSWPLLGVVSLASQRMTVYDASGELMHFPVSTGQPGHRTPTGVFSVIQKHRFHTSNIYSGAPMPFMQRITWSGIALHAGQLPGYPASHGCIRMPYATAQSLFGLTRIGMRVIVAPSDAPPAQIAHAALPVPKLMMVSDPGPTASAATPPLLQQASAGGAGSVAITDATVAATGTQTPHQRALAARVKSKADLVAAQKAEKEAQDALQRITAAADKINADLRTATAAHRAAEDQLDVARSAVQTAFTPEAQERAGKSLADAEARLVETQQRMTATEGEDIEQSRRVFAADTLVREARDAVEAARIAARLAEKGVEPMSIFVSRKEGKLYVRQGFTPIYEARVTVKEGGPLGTHVYTAVAGEESTGKLVWTSVSVPGGRVDDDSSSSRRNRKAVPEPTGPVATAAEALERVEMTAETRDWIAERIWVGGSLIVSDLGTSGETGKDTDFVVLTR